MKTVVSAHVFLHSISPLTVYELSSNCDNVRPPESGTGAQTALHRLEKNKRRYCTCCAKLHVAGYIYREHCL